MVLDFEEFKCMMNQTNQSQDKNAIDTQHKICNIRDMVEDTSTVIKNEKKQRMAEFVDIKKTIVQKFDLCVPKTDYSQL